jgi:hypothetical protein
MSVKEELHRLIDELPEEKIGQARSYLEGLRGSVARSEASEERAARVRSIRGKYAHTRTSSEDFMRRKQEEIALEEEQWERLRRGEG